MNHARRFAPTSLVWVLPTLSLGWAAPALASVPDGEGNWTTRALADPFATENAGPSTPHDTGRNPAGSLERGPLAAAPGIVGPVQPPSERDAPAAPRSTAPGAIPASARNLGIDTAIPASPVPAAQSAAYKGSTLAFRNVMSTIGFVRSLEPMHNPYYGMQLTVAPRYWFSDKWYARGSFDVATELTRADWTNDRLWIGDVGLATGLDGFYMVPVIDAALSTEFSASIPTSKASWATTRLLANTLNISLAKKFGTQLSVSYSGSADKYWNRYITGAPQAYLSGVCTSAGGATCIDVLVQSGRRNASWATTHGLSVSYKAFPWLGFSAGTGISLAFLYALPEVDGISLDTPNTYDTRYFMFSSLAMSVKASDLISFGAGARTFYAQLKPDGSYRTPFVNRFTQLTFDTTVSIEHLMKAFP